MTTLPRWASSSLQLQGSSYASCGNPAILNNLQSYTLEAWVYLQTLNGTQSVVGKRNINVDAAYQLYITQGGYVCSYYPSVPNVTAPANVLKSPQPLTVREWTHLATTYDSTTGTLTLYINGTEVAEGICPYAPYTSTANLLIGATNLNSGFTWFLQGLVGEVMIWNVCRTAEEVLNDSVQISYQGDTAVPSLLMDIDFTYLPPADWAGNNVRVSLLAGARFAMTIPGLLLNGKGYANCGTDPDLSMSPDKPYTIEGWFYYTVTGGTLVSKNDQGNAGEYLVTVGEKKITSMRSGLNFNLSSLGELSPLQYYHFATTYDHATRVLSIYVNGNLQCCQYAPNISSAPSVPFLIGATLSNTTLNDTAPPGGPTNLFQGYIQNIRVWDTCLEQDQIQQWMYNQPVYEPNLIAGFDFTVNPPVDTTGKHPIQMLNGAVIDANIMPIDPNYPEAFLGFIQSTNADYMSQHGVIPEPPPPPTTTPPAKPFVQFSAEFKNAVWADLEKRTLGDADDQTRQKTRARFEDAYARASAMAEENPNLLKVFTVTEENGLVKIIHHGIKGDTLIYEAPAAAVDDCTLWWMMFIYQLTAGFFVALGLAPSAKDILSRIWNLVKQSPIVIAACETLIGQAITIATAMVVVRAIYNAGYFWPIMKMCFSSLGWWGLGRILVKVFALAFGFEAAELLAGFFTWALQLGNHATKYSTDCPTTVISGEAVPSPAVA